MTAATIAGAMWIDLFSQISRRTDQYIGCVVDLATGPAVSDSVFISSIFWVGLMIHYRDEQVGDARRAHVSQSGQLIAINLIEQKNAAPKHLSLRQRLERFRTGDVIGMH